MANLIDIEDCLTINLAHVTTVSHPDVRRGVAGFTIRFISGTKHTVCNKDEDKITELHSRILRKWEMSA